MDFLEYFKNLPSVIVYATNREYRDRIRKVFRFDPKETYSYDGKRMNFEDLDEESKDELMFDSTSMSTSMDMLFHATENDPFFQDLYRHAAGRMFSESLEIGQAVVCSYDTFHLYYSCVWYYLHGGTSSLSAIEECRKLKAYFEMG
jgi:hypothetical protein